MGYGEYFLLLILLVAVMVFAVSEMRDALDEIDFERFSLWTCIAGGIAFVSGYIIKLPLLF